MNIVTFTGNRAEYYLLRPLLRRLLSEKKFNLKFIISGDIVKENDSQTLKDIQKDQIKIDKLIKIPNKYESHSEKIGYLCIEIPNFLKDYSFDLAIIYGDRFESFAFTVACLHQDIPIIHIEAGDLTEGGTYDDFIRHAITKMSHLFCTSTAKGIEIVKSLGEEDWRITQSGILSYEDMKKINNKDQQKIMKELKLSFSIPIILVTVHPIPKDIQQTKNEALNIFKALMKVSKILNAKIIITSPNDDKGSEIIKKIIKQYLPLISNSCFFESLGGYRYQTIMSLAKHMPIILCGNSSSLIKEAPFFGAHSLNIGARQNGRESASSQLNCPANEDEIFHAIKYLLHKELTDNFNPYFKEEPSLRIVNFIKNIYKRKSKSEILQKTWRKKNK